MIEFKEVGIWIGLVLGVLVFIACIVFSMRWFSNAVTPLELREPKPGIECATLVTADGAAIDCWKTNE